MQKILLLALFSAFTTLTFAQSEKKVKATVQKAIVYQQGAQLFSTENVLLQTGTTDIVFEGVSQYLDQNSLQANCSGNAVVIDVRYNIKYTEPEKIVVDKTIPEATMKRYERELKTVRDSLKELEVWTEEMNQRTNMVNSERSYLGNSSIIQGNLKRDSLNMFVRALDFWRIRNVTMNAELIKVMREQHKHYSTRQELEKRVNDIATLMSGIRTVTNATSPQPITQIIVSVMSEVTASSDVSINYFVAQAGWTAFYDLRASKENATIDLKHRAKVYQNTGLDWKNVSLVLSTGNPNQSNEKGSLNPFFYRV
jgi:uncharacterized protein (TIGR02231 family)